MSSVSRTPQGRWRARYRDPAGRSRSRTFDTKVEARRFLNKFAEYHAVGTGPLAAHAAALDLPRDPPGRFARFARLSTSEVLNRASLPVAGARTPHPGDTVTPIALEMQTFAWTACDWTEGLCAFPVLLPDPWVLWPAGEVGSVAAEGEDG
jgi:hypothetical protein